MVFHRVVAPAVKDLTVPAEFLGNDRPAVAILALILEQQLVLGLRPGLVFGLGCLQSLESTLFGSLTHYSADKILWLACSYYSREFRALFQGGS